MSNYLPNEIDPNTIQLKSDVPLKAKLEEAISVAKASALHKNCYVAIYHRDEGIVFRTIPINEFEMGYIQCPRYADEIFQDTNKQSRPLPSIIVDPKGIVVVSKPSLCLSCSHYLHKKVHNHCEGLQFDETNI